MHLKEGDTAPDFEGITEDGSSIKLSDFRGKKLILFFYPKDNTPTCTTEVCNLRDNFDLLLSKGLYLVGISPDSPQKHQNFIKKYTLPFPLIADQGKTIIKNYGVWGPKLMFGNLLDGVYRTTFVINEQGVIQKIISDVTARNHAAQILSALNI